MSTIWPFRFHRHPVQVQTHTHTRTDTHAHTHQQAASCVQSEAVWEMCNHTSLSEAVKSFLVWELQQFACRKGHRRFSKHPAWSLVHWHRLPNFHFARSFLEHPPTPPPTQPGEGSQQNVTYTWFLSVFSKIMHWFTQYLTVYTDYLYFSSHLLLPESWGVFPNRNYCPSSMGKERQVQRGQMTCSRSMWQYRLTGKIMLTPVENKQ